MIEDFQKCFRKGQEQQGRCVQSEGDSWQCVFYCHKFFLFKNIMYTLIITNKPKATAHRSSVTSESRFFTLKKVLSFQLSAISRFPPVLLKTGSGEGFPTFHSASRTVEPLPGGTRKTHSHDKAFCYLLTHLAKDSETEGCPPSWAEDSPGTKQLFPGRECNLEDTPGEGQW